MSLLQSLNIVISKRPTQLTPLQHRRNKLIKKLHEQLECAKATAAGNECVFTRYRSLKNKETGLRTQVEQQYRIKQWWYTNDAGKLVFEMRYGSKSVEIAKGKTGIEVDSAETLVTTIEVLKKAVEAGEVDEGINALSVAFGRQIKRK